MKIEEYKRVDSILRDMYRTDKGITEYIEKMEAFPFNVSVKIPEWNPTLAELKRIRHLRNTMAHEPNGFEAADSEETDLRWLKEFHERLLHEQDPLCLLIKEVRQKMEEKKKRKKSKIPAANIEGATENTKAEIPTWLFVILTILVIAVVLTVIFYFAR